MQRECGRIVGSGIAWQPLHHHERVGWQVSHVLGEYGRSSGMSAMQARVLKDELVDGVVEHGDALSDAQREHVHQEIAASIRERRAGGDTFAAEDVMAELASVAYPPLG